MERLNPRLKQAESPTTKEKERTKENVEKEEKNRDVNLDSNRMTG